MHTGRNTSNRHAQPYAHGTSAMVQKEFKPKVKRVEQAGRFMLHLTPGRELKSAATTTVSTELLGKARIPDLAYENADGSPLKITSDYFGHKRSKKKPTAGPFEKPGTGTLTLRVW